MITINRDSTPEEIALARAVLGDAVVDALLGCDEDVDGEWSVRQVTDAPIKFTGPQG